MLRGQADERKIEMKKVLGLIVVALVGFGVWKFASQPDEALSEKPVVKIGATLPLTGNAAEHGLTTKAALEMIVENMQKQGLKYDYKLIFEDSQLSPQKTAITTNKLINMDKVKAIFSMWNPVSYVVVPITEKNDMLSFACSLGDGALKGPLSFNMVSSLEDQGKVLIEQFRKNNIKTIASFSDNSAGNLAQTEAVANSVASEKDMKVVFFEKFNPGEKDFRTAISKADLLKPDIYVVAMNNPSSFLFIKQLGEITEKRNVTSIDFIGEIESEYRSIANGLWYVDSNHMGNAGFQKELKDKKGIDVQSCTGNNAANLQIFITAVENAPLKVGELVPSNQSVAQWIHDNVKDFKTAAGSITVSPNGHLATYPFVAKIENGKIVPIKE